MSSLQYDFSQTLNIGSQSTGAGAGKVTFNPFTITKTADQLSAPLFQAMASGTPFQFIEFLFVSSGGSNKSIVLYKVLLKLAAVKTMSVSSVACTSGCPGIAESVSFDYGGYILTTYVQKPDGTIIPPLTVKAFPNPGQQRNVRFQVAGSDETAAVSVALYDVQGRILYQTEKTDLDASRRFGLPAASALQPGNYYLKISVKDQHTSTSFILQP